MAGLAKWVDYAYLLLECVQKLHAQARIPHGSGNPYR